MSRELSTNEVAAELGSDRHKVAILIRQGHIKARRKYPKGKGFPRWVISEQAIEEYRRACA